MMKISVIISTYNNPLALEKSLWGFRYQAFQEFEILIADDGSTSDTRSVIREAQKRERNRISHVWHADKGFRKSEILNQAIRVAEGDYLIFTDGDCVPRDDFVLSHKQNARPHWFISGGSHIDIPAAIHSSFCEDDVAKQNVFDPRWLTRRGMKVGKYRVRLTRNRYAEKVLDYVTPRPGVLVGCNGSAWKKDILAVNGFDASSTYGSDDKELGARLTNNGVKSRRLQHSLICIHLSHQKDYSAIQIRRNREKLRRIKVEKTTWIDNGIRPPQAA